MITSASIHDKELRVPKPLGMVIGVVILTVFLTFFVLLAIYNLFNLAAIVPSILWLLLVGASVFSFCRENGMRQAAIEIQGAFALKEFIWMVDGENNSQKILLGYKFWGRRFVHREIGVPKIESVSWSTGQASSLAGRDVNDWHVAIWFDYDDSERSQRRRKSKHRKPGHDICIVGPSGRKEDTAAFGLRLVNFLREGGAQLLPGENETSFFRKS
jgi:hypothetical protein